MFHRRRYPRRRPGQRSRRRWTACIRSGSDVAAAPAVAAVAGPAKEKREAEGDQQHRADQVKHADRDEAQVPGDAERADDDEGDGEDSHGELRFESGQGVKGSKWSSVSVARRAPAVEGKAS